MSDSTSNPGLISGHVKLCAAGLRDCNMSRPELTIIIDAIHPFRAQGIAEQAIGSVTGNSSWTEAGETAKQAGVSELKEYQNQNPPSGDGSKIEAKLGQAVGCEGMVNEGDPSAASSASTTSTSTSTIGSDADAKGSIPGGSIGGTSLPGRGPGGADPAAGSEANAPTERIV